MVLIDTSILIDFYRKSKKETTHFFKLSSLYNSIYVSQITYFEVYIGSNDEAMVFWGEVFERLHILDFESTAAKAATHIYKELKNKNKLIETPDILIAATAIANKLPLATLNSKHFDRIDNLEIVQL